MHPARHAAAAALVFFVSAPLHAQSPVSFELRAGPAFAVDDLGDAELDVGFGFEGSLLFWPMPHTALYGGWDWHRFAASGESFAGTDVDVEETGYAFGLRFEHPVGRPGSAEVALRVGGTWNHIEIENDAGDLVVDSGHGLGWEAGAGFALPFRGWRIVPSVRYRALTRELEDLDGAPEVDLTYFTVEVGVGRRF